MIYNIIIKKKLRRYCQIDRNQFIIKSFYIIFYVSRYSLIFNFIRKEGRIGLKGRD